MADHEVNDDVKTLHSMGYAQELARTMGQFSNFAISFSIICILSGGITRLHRVHQGQAVLRFQSVGLLAAHVHCFSLWVWRKLRLLSQRRVVFITGHQFLVVVVGAGQRLGSILLV